MLSWLRYDVSQFQVTRKPQPTDAHQAEDAAGSADVGFHELVAHARDIVATIDRSGTITYVSPSIEQSLGLPPGDVAGKVVWELVHPDHVEAVYAAIGDVFLGHGPRSMAFQVRHVDGRWHTLDAVAHVLEGGAAADAVLNATDMTEVRSLEARLSEQEATLVQAQKMEVIGHLAGGIAHDFGNLLTIVIGATDQLDEGLPEPSPFRAQVDTIRACTERATAMTRQLLTFSRRQADELATIDLNDMLADAQTLLERLLGEHITLRAIKAEGLWPVRADRMLVERVLLNLAVNARDAMPGGGCLTIETRNLPADPEASDGSGPHQPSVAIIVTDTGVGMDSATRARAFEPFFTTKGRGKGTGFGLASVQATATDAGGWTRLESEPGKGTSITFALPRADDPVSAAGERTAPAAGGSETLLVVEDEEGVRELVRDMLAQAGYVVLEAATPSAAERICREHGGAIALLVSDVVMPEMSGVELSSKLEALLPGLRVMFISGYPEPAIRDGGRLPRGAHLLAKPFDRQTLLRAVRAALDHLP